MNAASVIGYLFVGTLVATYLNVAAAPVRHHHHEAFWMKAAVSVVVAVLWPWFATARLAEWSKHRIRGAA